MSIYNQKRKRSKKERVGFYTALSICIIAVGMAAYSTYISLSGYFDRDSGSPAKPVNQAVTGVTESLTEVLEATQKITLKAAETSPATEPTAAEESEQNETKTALQTMLTVNTSLSFPLDSAKIIREYSEDAVYNKTLNQWQAHTGADFQCQSGDNVYSMGDGEVTRIYDDDLLGKTVVVKSATYTAFYSGLSDNLKVDRGAPVKVGDVIGTAGVVPSEAMDEPHVHISIKVGSQYVDPLTLINNNE